MSIIADTIQLTIDGNSYAEDYSFSEFQLTQELLEPNMLRFVMQKSSREEDEKDLRASMVEELLGKTVELYVKTKKDGEDYDNNEMEFKGIIFNYNFFRQDMNQLYAIEIIAYSPDYLLNDSPHCYSYEDKTLKNIVEDVAKETLDSYEISLKNDPAFTDSILYSVRYNETGYEFLKRLAFRYGEWMFNTGKELVFGKIEKSDPVKLYPNYDIFNYYFWLELKHFNFKQAQHNYMKYENTTKAGLDETDGELHNLSDMVYDKSKEIFKKETFEHLKAAASEENSFDETEISAKVKGLGKKNRLTHCQGTTNRIELRIGSVVTIVVDSEDEERKTSGVELDDLLIYKMFHTINANGNYSNEFTAIPANCELPPYAFGEVFPKIETQRAVVMDNKDPEELARVRVQFLWQKEQDEEMMTPWIRIATPYAGDGIGFCFVPEIEEEVMVGFENGNAEKPYVIGALYHGKHKPRPGWLGDKDGSGKTIRSRSGQTIQLVDWDKDGNHKEGDGCICIWDNPKENYDICFSSHEKLIQFKCKGNIELLADGDIVLNAGGNIKAKAKSNIDMKADGEGKFKADGDLNMEGKNVSAKASSALSLEGTTAELKGSASGTVDGGGSLTLKGGAVSIN